MAIGVCIFCGGKTHRNRCIKCQRDQSVKRLVCRNCNEMTPSAEPECCHCGEAIKSELRWKIPLIIAIFAISFMISVILAFLKLLI